MAKTILTICRSPWLTAVFALTAVPVHADEGTESNWYLQAGGYTHFSDDEDYEGPPWFVGVEYQKPENSTMFGLSLFNNSFGDFTQYIYYGKAFHPSKKYPDFRIKLTGGFVHGYEGENQKIFPIRWGDAWGLAIVPSVGYQRDRWGFDVAILSASGLLFLAGYEFD